MTNIDLFTVDTFLPFLLHDNFGLTDGSLLNMTLECWRQTKDVLESIWLLSLIGEK